MFNEVFWAAVAAVVAFFALAVSVAAFVTVHRRERTRDVADVRVTGGGDLFVVWNHGPRAAHVMTSWQYVQDVGSTSPANHGTLLAGERVEIHPARKDLKAERFLVLSWQTGAGETLKVYRQPAGKRIEDGYPAILRSIRSGRTPRQILKSLRRRARWNAIQRWFR